MSIPIKNITSSPPFFLIEEPDTLQIPHILLIDNAPLHLSSLTALFDEKPPHITTAQTGLDALKHLQKKRFDLILLDMDIPDTDGYVLIDLIRKQAEDTDIIIFSGTANADNAMNAYNRGIYYFLKKPYSPEELLFNVRNAIAKRHLETQNRAMAQQKMTSRQTYRHLVEHLPDIICTLNEHGQITFINKTVKPLLGYSPDELRGEHYTRLIHESDLARVQSFIENGNASSLQVELHLNQKGIPHPLPFSLTLINIQSPLSPGHQIKGTYIIAQDISDNKRAEEIISFHTHYDALTELPNRILLSEKLGPELQKAKKYQVGLTLLFIDLDRFKLINDSLGRVTGDLLLKETASRLTEIARYSDIVARLGSDEFILAMPGLSDPRRAHDIAMRCLSALNEPFDIPGNNNLTISASIGIAIYPEDGETSEELIGNADLAMAQVKSEGKNGILFYDHSMAKTPQLRLSHEYALRRALEKNELEMYYQPQVDLTTGKIIGAEALMRWNHPERGLLVAGEFLPFAEENGLIIPMTDWMLEAVCYDIHIMRTLGHPPVPISVNLSPQYLDRCDCPGKMQKALERYNIAPKLIQVEITENICIRNPINAIAQLNELSRVGIDIAIDDFGTGYSSLAYLHRFPIQTIKIDRSFVSEINDSAGEFPVVLAIISIAEGLDMTLVAEGVETEVQAEYLQKWGCHIMQGYLYHRPKPLKQLLGLLTARG